MEYITSELPIPQDEYTQVLASTLGADRSVYMQKGILNCLKSLNEVVYPGLQLKHFQWLLQNTRQIGISSGTFVICMAKNFSLDEIARFDWITAEFDPITAVDDETRNDFLCFVAEMTFYKLLRFSWDNYGDNL